MSDLWTEVITATAVMISAGALLGLSVRLTR